MKVFSVILLLCLCYSGVISQGISINGNGKKADSTAMLDVSSATKGVLISRMSTAQRHAIQGPAKGLMVYDTSVNCLCIFSGSKWQLLCESRSVEEGLIAHYKFNGTFGDSSGSNLHPLLYGNPSFAPDRFGKVNGALLFDGIDDYLIVQDNNLLSVPEVTISLWFKTTKTGAPQELITRQIYSNASNLSWVTAITDASVPDFAVPAPYPCGTTPVSDLSNILFSNGAASLDQWYHLVCTFGNGFQKIYINGTLSNSMQRSFSKPFNVQSVPIDHGLVVVKR